MKKEYDFSKGRRNPYASRLKRQVTIRLDEDTIKYFKVASKECGIPYQTLMNSLLTEAMNSGSQEVIIRRIVREELQKTG